MLNNICNVNSFNGYAKSSFNTCIKYNRYHSYLCRDAYKNAILSTIEAFLCYLCHDILLLI